jgi:hypothetical protein
MMAALLFAAHPVHSEAVQNITGRAEPLMALFFLLGFVVYAAVVIHDRPPPPPPLPNNNTTTTTATTTTTTNNNNNDNNRGSSNDAAADTDDATTTTPSWWNTTSITTTTTAAPPPQQPPLLSLRRWLPARAVAAVPSLAQFVAMALTMACTVLALLSKEMGITLPMLCSFWDFFAVQRLSLRHLDLLCSPDPEFGFDTEVADLVIPFSTEISYENIDDEDEDEDEDKDADEKGENEDGKGMIKRFSFMCSSGVVDTEMTEEFVHDTFIDDDEDEDEDEIDGKAFKGEKSEKNVRPDNDASSRRGRGPGHGRHRRGRRWRRRYVPLRPRLWRWAARTAVLGVATGALCLWRVRLNGGNPPMFRYNANRFALEPYDGTVPLELTGQ